MNKARRKELSKIIELLQEAQERLEAVKEEEQEAFDNVPESLQHSERGETMEEYIYRMEEMLEALDTVKLLKTLRAIELRRTKQ